MEQRDGHVPLRRVRQRHAAPDGGGQTREHHQTVDETRREEAEGTQRGAGGEGDDDPGDAKDERLDEKIGADVGHRGSEFGEGEVHAGDEEHGAHGDLIHGDLGSKRAAVGAELGGEARAATGESMPTRK